MTCRALVVALACFVATADARAEKPPWAGQGKGAAADQGAGNPGKGRGKAKASPAGEIGKRDAGARAAPSVQVSVHFGDRDRVVVRDYFGSLGSAGRCPPGLAKKGNGCLPPGQAKKWHLGRPLPPTLVFHALPAQLLVQLRPPPAGYRYVRIAGDILMIAIGTSMVIDAIEDLGRL